MPPQPNTQPFNLRIYFAGLIVFTPTDDGMDALLVDARSPGRVPQTQGIERHFPNLHFEHRNLVNGPSSTTFRDGEGQQKHLLKLDDRLLRLDAATKTQETKLSWANANGNGLGVIPQSTQDAQLFDWVSPLLDRNGNRGKLKANLFGDSVVAAMRCDRGRLRPAGFASQGQNFVVGDYQPNTTRTVATSVVLETTVTSPTVEFTTTADQDTQRLVLRPAAQGPRDVEVWVMNARWATLRFQRLPPDVVFHNPDLEYHYFYNLLQAPPNPHRLPQATGTQASLTAPPLIPAQAPCNDKVMANLLFPSRLGGQLSAAAPCSPVFSG
jgi:hypothetical protein